jgi:hypothetical protein
LSFPYKMPPSYALEDDKVYKWIQSRDGISLQTPIQLVSPEYELWTCGETHGRCNSPTGEPDGERPSYCFFGTNYGLIDRSITTPHYDCLTSATWAWRLWGGGVRYGLFWSYGIKRLGEDDFATDKPPVRQQYEYRSDNEGSSSPELHKTHEYEVYKCFTPLGEMESVEVFEMDYTQTREPVWGGNPPHWNWIPVETWINEEEIIVTLDKYSAVIIRGCDQAIFHIYAIAPLIKRTEYYTPNPSNPTTTITYRREPVQFIAACTYFPNRDAEDNDPLSVDRNTDFETALSALATKALSYSSPDRTLWALTVGAVK